MTNYASITARTAPLSGEFGRDYALRVFGVSEEDLAAQVGRFSRGPRKGLLRGRIEWRSVERGGWLSERGRVVKPGLKFGHRVCGTSGCVLERDGVRGGKPAPTSQPEHQASPLDVYRLLRGCALKALPSLDADARTGLLRALSQQRRIAGLAT